MRTFQLIGKAQEAIQDLTDAMEGLAANPPGNLSPTVLMDMRTSLGHLQGGLASVRSYAKAAQRERIAQKRATASTSCNARSGS